MASCIFTHFCYHHGLPSPHSTFRTMILCDLFCLGQSRARGVPFANGRLSARLMPRGERAPVGCARCVEFYQHGYETYRGRARVTIPPHLLPSVPSTLLAGFDSLLRQRAAPTRTETHSHITLVPNPMHHGQG